MLSPNRFSIRSDRRSCAVTPWRRALAWGLACAVGWLSTVTAQSPDELQAYPLAHARAAQLEPVLTPLLAAAGGPTQLSIDTAGNRLLVAGPAEAHRITRQLIAALDRPQPLRPASGQPVLRSYAYSGEQLVRTARRLAEQWADDPAVRVLPDERTGQLLVYAPPAVHVEVPARLALLASTAASDSEEVSVPQPRRVRVIEPAHAQVRQLEPLLLDMFAGHVARRVSADAASAPGNPHSYALTGFAFGSLEIVCEAESNRLVIEGPESAVAELEKLLTALDQPAGASERVTRIMAVRRADLSKVRRAIDALEGQPNSPSRSGGPQDEAAPAEGDEAAVGESAPRGGKVGRAMRAATWSATGGTARLTAMVFQPAEGGAPAIPGAEPGAAGELTEEDQRRLEALGTDVEVEMLPDLDVVILRGNQKDVDEVIRIIQEIERLSAEAEPQIEVFMLSHVGSEKLATLFTQLKTQLLTGRQGSASVTALVKPNAVLLIGWGEAFEAAKELVAKLDQPVEAASQLRVFALKHLSAASAQTTVEQFFAKRTGLGAKVVSVADVRSNSLVVQADPRDLAEVELLLSRIDVPQSNASHELRVFRLNNTLAADLGPVLQTAIGGGSSATAKSAALKFLTIDAEGQRIIESGVLADVKITPDPRTNTLLISAPAETMELIAALVAQLDATASVAQIKVFTIINGDAAALVEMLRSLLEAPGSPTGPQLGHAQGEGSLAPLRFSVDVRTNSIIASGSAGDLSIVEAILLRLDDSDAQERKSTVYRLKNAPASNVAEAVNEFLRSERVVQQQLPGSTSPFRRIESEVVVVPEVISNSLILSATPRYYDEIIKLVEGLDAQPPQVMIQVLIAEVSLNRTDEFGVELGLQDSVLFDRSLLGSLVTTSTTTLTPGGTVAATNIVGATNTPGFDFNNKPLGNSGSTASLATAPIVGAQGLSHFNVGRVNSDLNFGGLVLSASSRNVSVLLRALQARGRVEVLSRPQVMTLDNQPAFIQVGQRIPRITGTTLAQFGQTFNVNLENVGLIMAVTPRISPEGLVVMEVDTEKSALDPTVSIPISTQGGVPVVQPGFTVTTAQTTVSAASGQTIVLGGLITKREQNLKRRVPYLSDIPLLGNLFRYDLRNGERRELLIILTPHIVRNEADADAIKQVEAARMSWCLADAQCLHGDLGLGTPDALLVDQETPLVIYPDWDPRGEGAPPAGVARPAPSGMPSVPPAGPAPPVQAAPGPYYEPVPARPGVAPGTLPAPSVVPVPNGAPTGASGPVIPNGAHRDARDPRTVDGFGGGRGNSRRRGPWNLFGRRSEREAEQLADQRAFGSGIADGGRSSAAAVPRADSQVPQLASQRPNTGMR